jgi:hypothetical protein
MTKKERIDYAETQCAFGHKYRTGDDLRKLERGQDDLRLKFIVMPFGEFDRRQAIQDISTSLKDF